MNPRPILALTFALALAIANRPVAAAPPAATGAAHAPRIEVLFALDSTGSMSSAIHEAKERILAIAESIASGEPRPDVRFGIVTYRDRGDAYITKRWALTRDWTATKAALSEIRADGGGDTPESVIQALHEGIRDTKWTLEQDVMKVVYLIGDAPPKLYDDDPDYKADLAWAVENGIVVQAIGCGGIGRRGADFFREVAVLTEGHYHAIDRRAEPDLASDTVIEAEAAARPRVSPDTLASVVERTARTYSGEIGVAYDDAEAEPVPTSLVDAVSEDSGGLLGDHVRVVGDLATWGRVWAAFTSTLPLPGPLPTVDFHAESVLVVTVAEGGIAGVSVARKDGVLVVRLDRAAGGQRVVMYRVPTWDGPVRIVGDAPGHVAFMGGE